ncbi:DNA phosphorothioation-dependent restriction protein DptH [Oceanobacter sp. 5_MG-2023]|uniref:DNA phosphorothioation-dependent restriction protein DptH n=1 Tax=Oceanobacter sp. 5_MG-2023 TaxID=3062645 RepID=UPI0026E215A8|nr:DNA phosphorothioation-dependent restriction protein DptH [Oceanobacter sp. 5_MG-2023]MDO6682426.1 DNA phosphorothioation-dependent restriction protein DptH [Oceanobacter sp. 5_MG-2023]
MSEKQFEAFLVEHLKSWLTPRVKSGDRFQFRSTDPDNTVKLIAALQQASDGTRVDGDHLLHYLAVNGLQVIIAGHAEGKSVDDGCCTENYLAHLRDEVVDWGTCLLMIHNSNLDTANNSALDLANPGLVWSVDVIKNHLEGLIDHNMKNQATSRCLLDIQSRIIASDDSSIFGYRSLYESMTDGDLRFDELHLFKDDLLVNEWSDTDKRLKPKQIERRIEENRKLYADIEFEIEHHSDDLEEHLAKFGNKFVKKHVIDSDSWKDLSYDTIISEIDKQKQQALEFDQIEYEQGNLDHRSKKETGAASRERHVLYQVPANESSFQFDLKFIGAGTTENQFELQPKQLAKSLKLTHRSRGNKTTLTIAGAMMQKPQFFSIRVMRELSSEQFKFHCVVLPAGLFYFEDITSQFLINRPKEALILQSEQQTLVVNPELQSTQALMDSGEGVDVTAVGTLDYQQLYDDSDEVCFYLKSGPTSLQIQVEGESPHGKLTLPLLMDTSRTRRLFCDDYYATYKSSKGSVVLDNQETKQGFLRQQLLAAEWAFIEQEFVQWNGELSKGVNASFLQGFQLNSLHDSYTAFLQYFKRGKIRTTPSLESWGPTLVDLAKNYVQSYLDYLQSLAIGKTLDSTARFVMKLGLATLRDSESGKNRQYLTPFHPLVLSYYLHLIEAIVADGDERSFEKLAPVTLKRLNARGLIPFLYDDQQGYSYTKTVNENPFWLEIVPKEDSSFEYISKLVTHKIKEFTETFTQLFETVNSAPVLINSINNAENNELFLGILAYYMDYLEDGRHIHVNLYDDDEVETEFDLFAEMATYDDIKAHYHLDKGIARRNTDTIIDVLRTRLTFSKFRNDRVVEQAYAHLSFFRNNQVVDARDNNIDEHLSSIACGGLLNGESSRSEHGAYFTAFGLKGVDYSDKPHLQIARLVGALWRPSRLSNNPYHEHSAISLAISDDVKKQLKCAYDNSVWVTVIDPKVTLDFFQSTDKDTILIHYSDQYTSSAGYDAITVTKQAQLYRSVLGTHGESLIREFNAFNGDWLLKMVNDPDTEKLAKEGVIASYKVVAAMLSQSNICWVPLSVAEMIRVSGNIGLAMSDSDFSRHNLAIKKGAISDDILFAGFKDGQLYLLPVEAKAGSHTDFKKARKQASELKSYMEEMLGQQNLGGRLYRGLFVRQVLLQIEKYQLYKVFNDDFFDGVLNHREAWLEGNYHIASLSNYPAGLVVAMIDGFKEDYAEEEDILQIEIPSGRRYELIHTPLRDLQQQILTGKSLNIPENYFLKPIKPTVEQDQENLPESHVVSEQEQSVVDTPQEKEPSYSPAETPQQDFTNIRVLIGADQGSSGQVYWEYGHPQLANRHLIVFGRSGQGKTYCIQGLLMELAKAKVKSLIIDYTNGFLPNHLEPEFNKFVKPKSSFLAQTPLGISPFRKQSQDFGGVELEEKDHIIAARIASVFNQVYSTIGEQQLATLTNVIESGVARHGSSYNFTCMLDDLYEEGKTGESLANKLSTMVKSNLFDNKESQSWAEIFNNPDSDVNVVQLASFSKDIMQIATEFILWDLYAYACANGDKNSPLPIVLDEVQNLDHSLESPLGKMLTEGRKYGLSLILATQTLSMLSREEQDRIFQAGHKLFFAPADTETQTYAKLLEQSIAGTNRKMWIKQLSMLQKGECISVGLHLDTHGNAVHGAKIVKVADLSQRL